MAHSASTASERRQHRIGELVILIGAITSLLAALTKLLGEAEGAIDAFREAGL